MGRKVYSRIENSQRCEIVLSLFHPRQPASRHTTGLCYGLSNAPISQTPHGAVAFSPLEKTTHLVHQTAQFDQCRPWGTETDPEIRSQLRALDMKRGTFGERYAGTHTTLGRLGGLCRAAGRLEVGRVLEVDRTVTIREYMREMDG